MTQSSLPLSQLPGVEHESSRLVLEFMAMLRRALSQQAPVKQALYQGICAVVAADPACASNLLAFLYPQLQRYIDTQVCP